MTRTCSSAVVIGMGFGDEGKGTVVNFLASKMANPMVVRYSGGQQAGHTVMAKGVKHVFSNFGSGTLQDTPSYWAPTCTIDPVGIANERAVLIEKGVRPTLYIDGKCPITTPWDKLHNQAVDCKNGTCGVGVGTTLVREMNKYSLLAEDLLFSSAFVIKAALVEQYYASKHIVASDALISQFYETAEALLATRDIEIVDSMPGGRSTIYESSQGLLLDQDIGFFPHVTRASVGLKNVVKLAAEGPAPKVYLVTRAFQTRHGHGPMTNTDKPHNIKDNSHEINVTNKYQGSFRRSLLDVDLLQYAFCKEDVPRALDLELVVTCMDLVEGEYRFTYGNRIISCNDARHFVTSIANALGIAKISMSDSPYGLLTPIR